MSVRIRPLRPPTDLQRVLDVIGQAAGDAGSDAHLVGGFVRDRLLGRPQGKDIDVVVVGGDGAGMLEAISRLLGWSRPAFFERFGTGMTQGDGYIVEVVQARAERYNPESRKPDVRPGTLREDIVRRDFTINALAQSLDGTVLDLTGQGLDDLAAGVLRTPLEPAETFSEDPLRMFRAARFVAQLGFRLAPGVVEGMRATASRSAILSAERIRDEICRLLVAPHPGPGLQVLRDAGLLTVALPELMEMVGVQQGGWHIYDVWDHTLHAVELAPPDLVTRLGCLFHDVGKPRTHAATPEGKHTFHEHPRVGSAMTEQLMARLRFSNEHVEQVAALVRQHMWPIQYRPGEVGDAAVRRFVRAIGPLRERLLEVARADTRASAYPDVGAIEELAERSARLDAGGQVTRLRPPLNGNELQAIANRGPGKWIARAQQALLEAILESELPADDPGAARAWLSRHPELLGD